MFTVNKSQQTHFSAVEEVLDDDSVSSVSEHATDKDITECLLRLNVRGNHYRALARSQSVSLDDKRWYEGSGVLAC